MSTSQNLTKKDLSEAVASIHNTLRPIVANMATKQDLADAVAAGKQDTARIRMDARRTETRIHNNINRLRADMNYKIDNVEELLKREVDILEK